MDMDFIEELQPAKSPVYDPAVALKFFQGAGKVEDVSAGEILFREDDQGSKFLFRSDKMYLLLQGLVLLEAGGTMVGTIGKGQVFGEMATIGRAPRTATAIAKTPCKLIALNEKQFVSGLQANPSFALMMMDVMSARLKDNLTRLSQGGAIAVSGVRECRDVLDRKLLTALQEELSYRAPVICPAGKAIIHQGDAGVFMYAVIEGIIEIAVGETVVERIGVGGVFGEMAVIDQSRRMATAVAKKDATLLSIARNEFLDLVQGNPPFALAVLRSLAERVRFITQRG